MRGEGRGIHCDGEEFSTVVATTGTGDADVVESGIHLTGNLLGADEEGGGLTQEVRPVVHGLPLGTLVGDETDDFVLFLAPGGKYLAQGLLHGDAGAAVLFALVEKKTVDGLVSQRMVDLGSLPDGVEPQGEGGEPFPVAVVPEIEETELLALALQRLLHLGDAYELHASVHLLVRHGAHLDDFHDDVAQEVVEPPFRPSAFSLGLFGEALFQLMAHQFPAVAYDMVCQRIEHYIGQEVVDAERQTRYEAQDDKQQTIHVISIYNHELARMVALLMNQLFSSRYDWRRMLSALLSRVESAGSPTGRGIPALRS